MRKWFKGIAFFAIAVCLAAGIYYWLWLPSPQTIERESYAAMSDYISSQLTGNSHDFGSANGLVIIYGRTTNRIFRLLPPSWRQFDSRMMKLETLLRSAVSEKFERKFSIHTPYVFTNDPGYDASDLSEEQRRRGYGVITFSKVIFNHEATHAVFYAEHLCGLCGGGRFVAMEKRNGHWIVIEEEWTWIS